MLDWGRVRPVDKTDFKLEQFALALGSGSERFSRPLTHIKLMFSFVFTALIVATAALILLFRIELSLETVCWRLRESV